MPSLSTRISVGLSAAVIAVMASLVACANTSPNPAPTPTDPIPARSANSAVQAVADDFVANQNPTTARTLLAAIEADGDQRWVPWLIDLQRAQVSTLVSKETGRILEDMTGIESVSAIRDLLAYGTWSQQHELDGGPGYRDFKIAMYENFDPAFGPLLRSVDSQVELAAIQWGGVRRGGIPELNNHPRVAPGEADWMDDDEVVMGVIVNGTAAAYPLAIMQRHELANDVVGGEPIAIVYCTLCKSGLVFDGRVDARVLHFETSGLLLNSNKIMVDRETDTLWHHLRGLAIGGPLLDSTLKLHSASHMRWSDWVAENPDTTVLALPEPIFFDDPERPPIAYDYTPGAAYASYYDSPDVWFPVGEAPDVFAPKTEVVGVESNGDSLAISIAEINDGREPLTTEVGGETFRFEPTGVGVRVFTSDGDLAIVEQSFWFAWFANHPETRTMTDF